MSADPATATPGGVRHLRRVARALDAALWLVALAVGVYSLANVHTVAVAHGTDDPQAWLLAPIVDVALFGGITADSVLSRYPGVHPPKWGTALRWFCGGATWTLNVWDAAASGDLGAIVSHSVPPIVLILLAEAAPRYRQQFAHIADTLATTPVNITAPDPAPRDTPASHPAPHPDTPTREAAEAGRRSTPDLPEQAPASHPASHPTVSPSRAPRARADKGTRVPRAARAKRPATRTDEELLAALDALGDAVASQSLRRTAAHLGIGETRTKRLLGEHAARRTPALSVVPTEAAS